MDNPVLFHSIKIIRCIYSRWLIYQISWWVKLAVVYWADINFVAGIDTGEYGTIISPSSAFLEITANDDPNGLLKFKDRSLDIPEDFLPGMEATTKKNLTVLRNQGTWGTVRVSCFIRHAYALNRHANKNSFLVWAPLHFALRDSLRWKIKSYES